MSPLSHLDCVLVVEDEYLIAMDVEQILSDLGCRRVLTASSQAQAMTSLEREKPDLVVLDILLGGVPCLALDQYLRSRRVPYIYCSGLDRFTKPGFDGAPWASKPPYAAEMLAAIRAALRLEDGARGRNVGSMRHPSV